MLKLTPIAKKKLAEFKNSGEGVIPTRVIFQGFG